ncbi:MAG: polysaccharide pyruvyl transferase family protein [Myxococcota bacterium]
MKAKKKVRAARKPFKGVWRPSADPVPEADALGERAATERGDTRASKSHRSESPGRGLEVRRIASDLQKSFEAKDRSSFFGVLKDTLREAKDQIVERLDADRALMGAMSATLELAASRYALDPGEQWQPGKPLKLLLAGYSGTRNTGADVRVEEMIRQFRHLFGDEHLEMSIYSIDPELTRGYFRTVRQIHLPKIFPKTLFDTVHTHHAVVACEGSMFKSKFANALSTMMVGAIGLAAAEGKLAVGYGGEAGKMDRALQKLVRRYCQDTLIIARNEASKDVLAELGVASRSGTDTAWTFDPSPQEVGRKILMDRGWDGETPVLALVPINPFWWPVKPHVRRAAVHAVGGLYEDTHYGSVYFHEEGREVDEAQERYLDAIAGAVRTFRETHDVFPVLYGSEQVDRIACEALDEKLGGGCPIIVSDEFHMYDMVSAMRQARYMVSSRYHACVMTMAGGVISAGITMDERIRNLMIDRGSPELALEVEDPDLQAHLLEVLEQLVREEESLRVGIDACVHKNLQRMGEMGMILVDYVRARHSEFPFRPELGEAGDPWAHLPSLPPVVEALVQRVNERNASASASKESTPDSTRSDSTPTESARSESAASESTSSESATPSSNRPGVRA